MEPTDIAKPRIARHRWSAAAAVAAASLALALPAAAGAQGAGQYEPSPPPTAGGSDEAPPSGGGETFGSSDAAPTDDSTPAEAPVDAGAAAGASDTVTESSGSDELPVTGLPAIPVAIAGLVMLILGALGVRSFSRRPAQAQRDPDDPSGTRRILGR